MRTKIKLNLRQKSREQKIQFGKEVHQSVNGNANFPNASAVLSGLQTATDELQSALTGYDEALALMKGKLSILRSKEKNFSGKMRQVANHVESESDFDASKMQSAGFELKSKTGVKKNTMVMTMIKEVKDINLAGCLQVRWKRIPNAVTYNVSVTTDVNSEESWRIVKSVRKSNCVVEGLRSGTSYWFRVSVVSAAGTSSPCDPANKIAP